MSLTLLGIKFERVQAQNAEFLDWLSPSYLKVEGRFSLLRKQRNENTLKWARNMPEFQNWQRSDPNSSDRLLWICATLGVGKSVMASYFVELLKCGYPEAFVGYFFCRSGEQGLTKAGEIIRTLAYQFVISNGEAQKDLDSSRMHGKIDPTTGVVFLFERLLEGILARTKGKVFIVLDGLDEADCNDVDTTSIPARSEMEIFLQCLCKLPNVHVLLISRPDIFAIIPKSVSKRLATTLNRDDIDLYVEKTIERSEQLKANFRANPDIDAKKYFQDKANGIFLWVVIVLHQLEQIQDIATFNTYIAEFADASGDMWTLYARVLSKFENKTQQTWVQEILKWVVVSKKITVDQLEAIVEWSLKNRLADFNRFLEVECGALIDVLSDSGTNEMTVHLVHETLRTFLISSKSCPSQFHVDEKLTHSYACSILLDILSTEDTTTQRTSYAANSWLHHLMEDSDAEIQSYNVLEKLYRFLHSPGCKTWIRQKLLRDYRENLNEIEVSFDEPSLSTIWKYFQRCGVGSASSFAVQWRSELVKNPAK